MSLNEVVNDRLTQSVNARLTVNLVLTVRWEETRAGS